MSQGTNHIAPENPSISIHLRCKIIKITILEQGWGAAIDDNPQPWPQVCLFEGNALSTHQGAVRVPTQNHYLYICN